MLSDYGETGLIWIDSNGGPLLVLPGEYLGAWEGTEPPSGGRHIAAVFRWDGPDSPATDYDRACDVDGYAGLLEVGEGRGLVLGGEPTGTAWVPRMFNDLDGGMRSGGLLVRWITADSVAHVVAVLHQIPDDVWADEGMTITVGQQPLYLFDSAFLGAEAGDDNSLRIPLPAGEYTVATGIYRPDQSTHLVLHRLTRTR